MHFVALSLVFSFQFHGDRLDTVIAGGEDALSEACVQTLMLQLLIPSGPHVVRLQWDDREIARLGDGISPPSLWQRI